MSYLQIAYQRHIRPTDLYSVLSALNIHGDIYWKNGETYVRQGSRLTLFETLVPESIFWPIANRVYNLEGNAHSPNP